MKNTSRLGPVLFGRWCIPLAVAGSLLGGLALGCDHDDRRGDEGVRRDDSGWHDHDRDHGDYGNHDYDHGDRDRGDRG
jgi:hypothetical protein